MKIKILILPIVSKQIFLRDSEKFSVNQCIIYISEEK